MIVETLTRNDVVIVKSNDFPTKHKLFRFKSQDYANRPILMRMDGRTVKFQQDWWITRLATPFEIVQWKITNDDNIVVEQKSCWGQ